MSGAGPATGIPVAAMVAHCCRVLGPKLEQPAASFGLVVGCGKGDEVAYLRGAFQSPHIFGVDIETRFSPLARASGSIAAADALHLPFSPAIFEFAAAFHSLEHVGGAAEALEEISRVLRPGAWLYVGVPNRKRVLGYIGSFDASTWQKAVWNLQDWVDRFWGRFRNEAGAHAGFDGDELLRLLSRRFFDVQLITGDFLRFKYACRIPARLLNILLAPPVINYSAPSHYAICRNAAEGTP
ncbi:MAG TPA: class I SAM-dependent methyltransferase [Terriglobia bacterium]|nr:class I SAM-dependent methyltransferase [Terriglobia bacterium]